MAEVIVQDVVNVSANVGGVFQLILSPIMFLLHNWYFFFIAIFLALAIGIVIYFVYATKDLKRERDEAGYFLYKKTMLDCIKGRDVKKYRKTYSFIKNIFWLGLPFLSKDESKLIFNKYGMKIGRYRGHIRSQDGTYNLLICTSTSFGIMDNNILLKIPSRIKIKNNAGEDDFLKFDLVREDPLDKTMTVKCIGIERTALFYYMPVFTIDNQGSEEIVDLREYMESSVADSTYQVMLQRMLNASQKQMEKAIEHNPNLLYAQKSPEKTTPEQDVDNAR